jgi:BASS family bile acid:Na+ symporter
MVQKNTILMLTRIVQAATNLFPLWSILTAVLALTWPDSFSWFGKESIRWGLGIIMLGMGLTLTWNDFLRVFRTPIPILVGICLQFIVMPGLGWGIGRLLELPAELAAGLILVSCCPGGTASNVVVYLARANVALSVAMTAFSTILAVVATPYLTAALAGTMVPVDAVGLLKTTFTVVILPVTAGALINQFFRKQAERVSVVFPLVSVIFIILIVGFIMADQREKILEHWQVILSSVLLLHGGGFLLGYWLPRLLGFDELVRRTISVEVGMQNSGLGSALATKHFAATPMVAVPSAISAVVHCILGSILAGFWRSQTSSGKIKTQPRPPL